MIYGMLNYRYRPGPLRRVMPGCGGLRCHRCGVRVAIVAGRNEAWLRTPGEGGHGRGAAARSRGRPDRVGYRRRLMGSRGGPGGV